MSAADRRRSLGARLANRLPNAQLRPESVEEGSTYCIRAPYRARRRPRYFPDRDGAVVFQPDVYRDAASLAAELGAERIVDLGCGSAAKLAELHPRFDLVGIDMGPNLAQCRARYGFGSWLEHDLDGSGPLPLAGSELRGAVLVAADVVEHLRRPERLLHKLARALEHAGAALVSTPERDLVRGTEHNGPPPNPAHAREWNIWEFAAFLAAAGLRRGSVGLTRTRDNAPLRRTILAVLRPDGPPLRVEP